MTVESFSIESYSKSSDAYNIRYWMKSSLAAVRLRPNSSVSSISQRTLNMLDFIEEKPAHEYRLHDFLEVDNTVCEGRVQSLLRGYVKNMEYTIPNNMHWYSFGTSYMWQPSLGIIKESA